MSTKRVEGRTCLDGLFQSGASKIVFPHRAGAAFEAVTLNTSGGVTGGDVFDTNITAGAATTLSVTTQAAERAYAAQPGEIGQVRNHLRIADEAQLSWLPQETILFNASHLDRTMRIDLAKSARLLFVEPVVFGRAAMGETLTLSDFSDRVEIWRDNAPLFMDAVHLTGDVAGHLALPTIAAGAGAMAAVVFVSPRAEAELAPMRALLPAGAGASLIRDDLLFVRILARDGWDLRQSLVPVLEALSETNLPRCWML